MIIPTHEITDDMDWSSLCERYRVDEHSSYDDLDEAIQEALHEAEDELEAGDNLVQRLEDLRDEWVKACDDFKQHEAAHMPGTIEKI